MFNNDNALPRYLTPGLNQAAVDLEYSTYQMNKQATSGFRQAMGDPSPVSAALGFAAGALTAKLIFDIFDR